MGYILTALACILISVFIVSMAKKSKIADYEAEIAGLKKQIKTLEEQNKTELAEGYKIGYDEAMETAKILMQKKRRAGGTGK